MFAFVAISCLACGALANDTLNATVLISVHLEPAELPAPQSPAPSCFDAAQNHDPGCESVTAGYTLEQDPDSGNLLVAPI